ncbi:MULTISPECIES: hypothetical protein [Paracoccus]|jgi:hypothetical protein|uniref:Uncharacterized protein n=1 Tax=Paracoccus litorisediminis TaxID=2006130 RepID=A0A844HF51_9RHOB|nr:MULTISPECIES: hypothetical protein [Paracoccus]MBD9525689.1 hypothetical protein [Paracoccus sp. PAR01]MTH58140.1 hypothetical protein [Paracoccus litorisediminis]
MIDTIRPMADEVASLMAARFGGVRRGHTADLAQMLKRRGGALPRKLRREAMLLAHADSLAGHPKLARQVDFQKLDHAHRALTAYLRPLGQAGRIGGGVLSVAASVIFGLMILGAFALWIMTMRGLV